MTRLDVTPTRMELGNLRKKLAIAKRSHKMLKDKLDSLVQKYVQLDQEAHYQRQEVEGALLTINESFIFASMGSSDLILHQNLRKNNHLVGADLTTDMIFNLQVPRLSPHNEKNEEKGEAISSFDSYSFLSTSSDTDQMAYEMRNLLPGLLKLAETEKACQMLSKEMGTTRRRVNALEFRTIVDIEETITYILMKISENERNNTAKLMALGEMQQEKKMKNPEKPKF